MSSNKNDISQLQQYLNGELDARAMHELERRAQDDPFLMDALEGYEAARVTPGPPDAELQLRLQQRISRAERKIIPWAGISIAASILLVGSIGLWLYLAQHKPEGSPVAATPPAAMIAPAQPQVVHPYTRPPVMIEQKALEPQSVAALRRKPEKRFSADLNAPAAVSSPAPVTDVLKNVPDAALGYNAPADTVQQYASNGYYRSTKMTILSDKKKVPTIKPGSRQGLVNQQLLGRVEGVNVEVAPGQHHEITGQLLDGIDGQPLANALVRIKGAGAKTMTDQNGNFKIEATGNDLLVVSSIGYQSKQVKAAGGDSLKLALQPTQSSLNEVAVVRSEPASPAKTGAMPVAGTKAYQQYLDKFAAPNHQKGIIRLELTVGAGGSLSNFKVLKGLTDEANQAAIAYVKAGPAWRGNPDGKPETVVVQLNVQ